MPAHRKDKDYLKHEHEYQLTRTRTEVSKDGRITTYRFYVCVNRRSPCPERDKVEIEYSD